MSVIGIFRWSMTRMSVSGIRPRAPISESNIAHLASPASGTISESSMNRSSEVPGADGNCESGVVQD